MEQTKRLLNSYLRVTQRMSRQFRDYFDQPDLTLPQMLVLTALGEEGTMPISQLARYVGSANSTVSGIVDRLEKMGLVERIRSEEDRRVIHVGLTAGYRARKKSAASVSAYLSKRLSSLSAQELDDIRISMEMLDRALDQG
ncbi:MAG: MarR family transcriptional regulator [Ruminococcaceae bacterium]|nr:MarR family transcriptional regulator [Oscillospiraceae bacterium]